mgnify:CR=1 FL=1
MPVINQLILVVIANAGVVKVARTNLTWLSSAIISLYY